MGICLGWGGFGKGIWDLVGFWGSQVRKWCFRVLSEPGIRPLLTSFSPKTHLPALRGYQLGLGVLLPPVEYEISPVRRRFLPLYNIKSRVKCLNEPKQPGLDPPQEGSRCLRPSQLPIRGEKWLSRGEKKYGASRLLTNPQISRILPAFGGAPFSPISFLQS